MADLLTGLKGPENPAHSLAFSPNGKMLASAHVGGLKLWDVTANMEIATLKGHKAPEQCVAFSPDGGTLASGDHQGEIKLWDVPASK